MVGSPSLRNRSGDLEPWHPNRDFSPNSGSSGGSELCGAIVSSLAPIAVNVGIDNQGVVSKSQKMIPRLHEDPIALPPLHWATQRDGDLWKVLQDCLLHRGPHSYSVTKVKGHATEQHIQQHLATTWTKTGNDHADALATLAVERNHGYATAVVSHLLSIRSKKYIDFINAIHNIIARLHNAHNRLRQAPAINIQQNIAHRNKILVSAPYKVAPKSFPSGPQNHF